MSQYNYQQYSNDQGLHDNGYFLPSDTVNQGYTQPTFFPGNTNQGHYAQSTPLPQMPQSNMQYYPSETPNFGNQFAQNIALKYGTEALGQGRQVMQQKVEKLVSLSKWKHYFAVDNKYVAGKLAVLCFPFFHSQWDLKYDSSGAVPPRSDMNSPDLYIPVMAFITYIIVAGIALGVHGSFSPESLGIFCSQSLGWLIFEVAILTFAFYLLNIQSQLSYIDILCYSGYKFVHMNTVVVVSLILGRPGYYFALLWTGLAFAFFQIRSLKMQVLPHADSQPNWNPRRGVYLLASTALFQPLVVWWLTSSVVI